jgi:DNA mismatch endonuclease (patch repair protein)
MSEQQQRDTAPEMRLRRALHACGERYRVGYPVPGMSRCTIDVAFPGRRVAVFVDGCFWHRCPEHRTSPKANSTWWDSKLDANQARDERVSDALASAGWTVIRVWEHEPTASAAARVLDALRRSTPHVSTAGDAPTVAAS